ncbi:MAG: tyrosine-protein phosphatase [Clostridiales bacterium]|nr:tyrosine-protein phosphatase [Clostridiales bacterium]
MLKQAIDLPGIGNARELGGYTIGDKHIRPGLLLRTSALKNAAPVALDKLKNEFRLQTVIDLRMTGERDAAPSPVIPGVENIHLPVIEFEDYVPPDPKMLEEYKKGVDRMRLFKLSYDAGMLGPSQYLGFLLGERGKRAYREFFRILQETDPNKGAILWHCTDGKDRTGCATMLLLTALGASRETIIADYMLTNDYNAAQIEAVRQKIASYQMPQKKLDALLFISGAVIERYMTEAIDTLNEKYGSVKEYMRVELDVDEEEIMQLCKKYLY